MVKVSGLPPDPTVDGNHYVVLNDPTGPTTKRGFLSVLAAFFFNQDNIPDGTGSPRTRMIDFAFDFVASGMVWTGDAYASTRAASMTAGVIYINGRRISISAVTARLFTASKDTYVDVLDNGNGTGSLVYTEVANNAASPSLAANSVRIGIIVTGASNIAAVGSINQGQEDKVLPIVSSVPYQVTDSLGNLINPRDSSRKILGARMKNASFTAGSTAFVDVTGMSVPFIAPGNRKVKVTLTVPHSYISVDNCRLDLALFEGGTALNKGYNRSWSAGNGGNGYMVLEKIITPSAGLHTYKAQVGTGIGAGVGTFYADADTAYSLKVELK